MPVVKEVHEQLVAELLWVDLLLVWPDLDALGSFLPVFPYFHTVTVPSLGRAGWPSTLWTGAVQLVQLKARLVEVLVIAPGYTGEFASRVIDTRTCVPDLRKLRSACIRIRPSWVIHLRLGPHA